MAATIETDVAIIGAGPVGLFAVFECGMLKMRCVVVDALQAIGGQCAALYPEKPIFDIPAHPSIDAQDLVAQLEKQAAPFTPIMLLGRRVETLQEADGAFTLTTSQGDTLKVRAVVIAAGAGAFGPNRPPLEGLPGYETSGAVRYLVARRDEFAGKRVVIAGGGDSAVDWALSLKGIAKVTVVHRRPKFRAAPESAARLEAAAAAGEIEMAIPYQLHGLEGDGTRLTGVVLATLKGETKVVPADHLLAFFGLSMGQAPCRGDAGDLRDLDPRRFRHRRHRHLSGQAEADPAGLQRGGHGGACHPSAGFPGRGASLRVFDDEGRTGRLICAEMIG